MRSNPINWMTGNPRPPGMPGPFLRAHANYGSSIPSTQHIRQQYFLHTAHQQQYSLHTAHQAAVFPPHSTPAAVFPPHSTAVVCEDKQTPLQPVTHLQLTLVLQMFMGGGDCLISLSGDLPAHLLAFIIKKEMSKKSGGASSVASYQSTSKDAPSNLAFQRDSA